MKKKKIFIIREVHAVQNRLKTELVCSMQMKLGGREMTPWETGSRDVFCRYVLSHVLGFLLITKRCSLLLEATCLRIQQMCNF